MTELELLIDFHKDAERQGPGSTADTLRAVDFIGIDRKKPLKVVDIGCGTGAQTITLAQNLEGHITAVDLFPEFLEKLNLKTKELGLQDNITTLQRSMDDLPFGKEGFDIIWSEGAIYIMGFEAGINNPAASSGVCWICKELDCWRDLIPRSSLQVLTLS